MEEFLILPVRLKTLFLRESGMGVSPSFNFSKLPFTLNNEDHNADKPFLSDSIADVPFLRPDHALERGVHIHWMPSPIFRSTIAIPVISRAFLNTIASDIDVQDFISKVLMEIGNTEGCFVIIKDTFIVVKPFRFWEHKIPSEITQLPFYETLKARLSGQTVDTMTFPAVPDRWTITRLKNDIIQKEWIVESDFVHQNTPKNAHRYTTVPIMVKGRQTTKESIPYQYLGRSYEKGSSPADIGTYMNELDYPLTALGYGEISFSSYYPNCKSVFGFYDEEIKSVSDLEGIEYRITGEYSKPELDYWNHLKRYLTFESGEETDLGQQKFIRNWVADRLQLHIQIENDNQELPEKIVCHGRSVLNLGRKLKADDRVNITVANSGIEAISAALSYEIADKNQQAEQIEDLLEAVLLNDSLEGHTLDVGLKFRELRHKNEFYTNQGGKRWVIRAINKSGDKTEENQKQGIEFTEEMSNTLSALNNAQKTYDSAIENIRSYKQTVFDYWHHYMQSTYVNELEIDTYPHSDDLKNLLEYVMLPHLKKLQQDVGTVNISEGNHGDVQNLSGKGGALAKKLATSFTEMKNTLLAQKDLALFTIPSTRFWIPREPAICLSGTPVKGLLHDNRVQDATNDLNNGWINALTGVSSLNSTNTIKGNFTNISKPEETWDPLFLDWQVAFFPVSGEFKPDLRAEHYSNTYLTDNFLLNENQPELELKKNIEKQLVSDESEILEGRSALNPFSQQEIYNKLLAHCRHLLNDKNDSNLEQLRSMLTENTTDRLQLETLMMALDHLGNTTKITQSLTGFHRSLTGRRLGWQLPVADPLGFESYREFAEKIESVTGNHFDTAPQANKSFHPIRSGEMEFRQLRLIDSFGQYKDLPIGEVKGAEKMNGSKPERVSLAPRFMQGLQINFRWTDGSNEGEDSHQGKQSSPVAGWILPEYLENKLLVFDQNGIALGSLSGDGWSDTVMGTGVDTLEEISERSLKGLCMFLNDRIDKKQKNFDDLLNEFREADRQMAPHFTDDGDFMALLFGQPLAVLHATVGFQLQGNPVNSVTWNECWNVLNHPHKPISDGGFTEVDLPVRIGEHHQLNDGVVWFWEWEKENNNTWMPKTIYAPQESSDNLLSLTISSRPKEIGLLFHPMGKVHITTGVLPVKSIQLPVVHFQEVMKNLKGSLFTGPSLVEKENMQLPLARLVRHNWKWHNLEKSTECSPWQNGPWQLPQNILIKDGWLTIESSESNEIEDLKK